MKFEWDEAKNRENITKHGISFEQAREIFDGFTVDFEDDRFSYEEHRECSIGRIGNVAIVVVIHTDRDGVCRIITARAAMKNERRRYEREIRKTLGF